MAERAKIGVAMIVAAVPLAMQLWASIRGIEDWPFTCAPMYANYLPREVPRYRFMMTATFRDGTRREIGAAEVGFIETTFWRLFFKHWYGTEADNPHRALAADTPEKFRARMTKFFGVVAGRVEGAETIALSVVSTSTSTPRLVGTYRAGAFEHAEQPCR